MKKIWVGIGAIALNEYWCRKHRDEARKDIFSLCRQRSYQLNKPLLVIGRPDGWTNKREVQAGDGVTWWRKGAHPCGDFTVDIRPKGNSQCPNYIQTSAEDLSMFPNQFFGATFSSCTLEHVPDAPKAFKEIQRVTDQQGAIGIVRPQPYSLFAWLFPEHRWVIFKNSNGNPFFHRLSSPKI